MSTPTTNSVRAFRITTRYSGRKRAITVKVYDDLAAMRTAAHAFTTRAGYGQPGEFDTAAGVTHTFESVFIGADGEEEKRGAAAALIRLWRGHLGSSVICHEAAHAASAIYRQDWEREHGPVHRDMDNEEVHCYLIGDITRRIVDRLYHYDCYAD